MLCSLCNFDSGGNRQVLAAHKADVHGSKRVIAGSVIAPKKPSKRKPRKAKTKDAS